MARKLKSTDHDDQHALIEAVRESAQQIWQAGLGAFFKAQQEESAGVAATGGGEQAFQKLVEEGSVLQKRVRASDEEVQADGDADADARDVKAAGRSWDKLEQVFEDRVVRALGAIGVPSKRDIDQLTAQIAQLAEQVAQLQAQLAAPAEAQAAAKKRPA